MFDISFSLLGFGEAEAGKQNMNALSRVKKEEASSVMSRCIRKQYSEAKQFHTGGS